MAGIGFRAGQIAKGAALAGPPSRGELAVPELRRGRLFVAAPNDRDGEQLDVLAQSSGVRIERIVSSGHASPSGFWYDQDEDEFVVLLAGAAELRFAGDDRLVMLRPGDWIDIPAGVRHRVESTQADPPTVWLVVHRPVAVG